MAIEEGVPERSIPEGNSLEMAKVNPQKVTKKPYTEIFMYIHIKILAHIA
jgi:hypothetical protein